MEEIILIPNPRRTAAQTLILASEQLNVVVNDSWVVQRGNDEVTEVTRTALKQGTPRVGGLYKGSESYSKGLQAISRLRLLSQALRVSIIVCATLI